MKTKFTYSSIRTLFLTFVSVLFALVSFGQTTHPVSVTDYAFTPKQLTITAGDKVVWTNTGAMGHNVDGLQTVFPNNPVSFGNSVGLGWSYEFVFNTAGTYNYHCDPHAAFGMTGQVIVNPKSSTEVAKLADNSTDNFSLYPNPASQYIELMVPFKHTNISSLKVYSITGALIDQKVLSGNTESFRYDISSFKSGIYFMEINSSNQRNTLKFLKQ